jgi:hypothetical protein
MQVHVKLIVAIAAATLAGAAAAQAATNSTRSAGEATRDAASATGRAASAAVTPGDQNMGRNPANRTGGLMGNDRTGAAAANTGGSRRARADRG